MNIDTSVVGITIPQGAVKNIKRGTELLWQDGGLPTAFQRCEWIKSDGKQSVTINDFKMVVGTVSVESDMRLVSIPSALKRIIGFGAFSAGRVDINSNGNYRSESDGFAATTQRDIMHIEVENSVNRKRTIGVRVGSDYFTNSRENIDPSPYSLCVGNYIHNRTDGAEVEWYGLKLFVQNTLTNVIIPCYLRTAWNNIPAGTIGLYDLCGSLSSNGTPFYTNDGTGAFTKGADVA